MVSRERWIADTCNRLKFRYEGTTSGNRVDRQEKADELGCCELIRPLETRGNITRELPYILLS